ncbi:peptidase S41 [Acidithiobacillus thiooxidans]|uniref:Peptidase S41 n=2 Tax=Acidithiobacillus thiooxidans TaxID=930 RepID=A0A1C2I9K7_ACITH|nr:peptidase S41 [Acidithiobacillus thiooxidans]OCX71044.1 peptidase S41 [Acidithiobacillus thiooxidans]OCX72679.1 peptidase S41 [Acidithiobacillus thiooxidans]OCX78639.1 peptidase S41 [Acidithiobacillus thiooxidans]OCX80149.1 peptidase S41 [Acidithiobacillus thiooxidans]
MMIPLNRILPRPAGTWLKLSVVLMLGLGSSYAGSAYADADQNHIPLEQIQTLSQVFEIVKSNYVDPTSDKKLMTGAISGMVSALDPHSAYLTPKEFKEMQVVTDGKFGGLGIEVTGDHGVLKVVAPIDGTPAAKAGVEPGDLIVKIDGKALQGIGLQKTVDMMRGKPGTQVTLTILRPHQNQPIHLTLTRAIIKVQSVRSAMLAPDYGYIRISQFQENTGRKTRQAVEQLEKAAHGHLKGLILDLRNNPGGVLGAGVETADTFLNKGLIVYTKGRTPDSDMRFTAHGPDYLHGAPMIVLINGGSASAAEIVTGALKDDHRALVMGQRSFGKGSVQTVIPLSNGGALKLTTALYYTPAGCSIQSQGIVPNVEIQPANPQLRAMDEDLLKESELQGVLKAPDTCSKVKPQYTITAPASKPALVTAKTSSGSASEEAMEAASVLKPNLGKDYVLREALAILEKQAVPVDENGHSVQEVIPLSVASGQ